VSGGAVVIAIDGPAGSGKSTVARAVADALGLSTLDTGAMYRAVTLVAMESGLALDDGDRVAALADGLALDVADGAVLVAGRDVSSEIRGPEVTGSVSTVANQPPVRAVLVRRQREWIDEHGGGVVEGRDIGTVVLPDATVKVFLTARDDVRAERRRRDEAAADRDTDVAAVQSALGTRDRADASLGRALRAQDAAPDALVIDTSGLAVEEVVAQIVARARMSA
jgi:CMP/dCMP kinase